MFATVSPPRNRFVERERARRSGGARRRVLGAEPVVERDPAQAVRERAGVRRRARLVDRGRRERPRLAVERQREHDLAEAVVVEVLGDDERLREAHEHALVALGNVGGRERHRHVGRRDAAGAAAGRCSRHRRGVAVRAVDRGLVEALAGEAGHADDLRRRSTVFALPREDEDPVRGRRVAVAGRVLEVEALDAGRSPSKSPTTTPWVVTLPVIAATRRCPGST